MSYSDHSAQRCFKSNAPVVMPSRDSAAPSASGYSERWNARTPSYKRNEKGRKEILHIVHTGAQMALGTGGT